VPSISFVFGSAAGTAVAWFLTRGERSRLTVAVITGAVCGLLGIATSAIQGTAGLAAEAELGLLGAAAPLTLCMTPLNRRLADSEISSIVRHLAATLSVALVYGISCATVGFVSTESVRLFISAGGTEERPVDYPITTLRSPPGTPNSSVFGRL
jgi:hypothetical protein